MRLYHNFCMLCSYISGKGAMRRNFRDEIFVADTACFRGKVPGQSKRPSIKRHLARRCGAGIIAQSPQSSRSMSQPGLIQGLTTFLKQYFRVILCRAKPASVSGDGEESPARGWGDGLAADGELVHRAANRYRPQAVADGSSPRRFPCSRVAPKPKTGKMLDLLPHLP